MLVSFASKSPLIYPTMSCESLLNKTFLATSAWAIPSPIIISLYSTSLLVIGNLSWTPYFKISLSGEMMTTPTLPLFYVDDPSVWIVQSSSWLSSCSGEVNSAMKSTSTWAFMVVQGWYSISNWLSSMAHCIIYLVASGLFIAFLIGWYVITTIGLAWKYGRSFLEATIRAKVIFSIHEYRASAPWMA